MTLRTPLAFFSMIAVLLFVLSLPGIADARGGRGGGGGFRGGGGFSRGGGGFARSSGGFSRSSVASGGSFSSRSVSRQASSGERGQRLAARERPAQPMAGQGGGAERQQQRQDSAAGRQQSRQESAGARQESRTGSREDWQSHMREQQEERQDWVEDEHWDDHWHHGHYDEGEVFVAGAMIGATAGAAAARSTYVATLPCAATTVIANGVTYYNCGGTWYSRGYESGSVVYVVTDAP